MSLDELRAYVAEVERQVSAGDDREWLTPAPPVPRRPADQSIDQAASLATTGRVIEGTRLSGVKRGLLRALQVITRDQNAFNGAIVEAARSIASDMDGLRRLWAQRSDADRVLVASLEAAVAARVEDVERIQSSLSSLEEKLESLAGELDRHRATLEAGLDRHRATLQAGLDRQRADLARLSADVAGLTEQLRAQDDRLTIFLQEARSRLPEPLDGHQLATFSRQLEGRFDALYTEFENRYRGSRQDIIERLGQYDGILDLDRIAGLGPIVDLGSGRGEWLELLRRRGIAAYGVDVNDDIARVAGDHGLEVRVEDGLEHLRTHAPGSLGMVSMFHVAEHLEFETLFDVVRSAHTALSPGGVLLVETPNPTNLMVGAASFYRDPTHRAPLHPQLMEFLAEAAGFDEVELRFLNPPTELPFELPPSFENGADLDRLIGHLNWALLGPQDYCVIAHKAGAGNP